jgi:hypothetical protein
MTMINNFYLKAIFQDYLKLILLNLYILAFPNLKFLTLIYITPMPKGVNSYFA